MIVKYYSASEKAHVNNLQFIFVRLPGFCFSFLQMDRLQDLVRKSEQGLGTAEGHISNLQETQEILQKELELMRARLRETTDSLYNVEVTQ